MKIAVVGAGPAGASCSVFLSNYGFDVTNFEKVAEPGPVGAGIMLQRTGHHILNMLGHEQELKEYTVPIKGLKGYNTRNKRLLKIDFTKGGDTGHGLQRGALFNMTYADLKKSDATHYTGKEVVKIKNVENCVELQFSDGDSQKFDVAIVANGARTNLRNGLPITKINKPQRWGAVWTLLKMTEEYDREYIVQVYRKTSQMLGFMPVGRMGADQPEMVNFFWSIRWKDVEEWKNSSYEGWIKQLEEYAPWHQSMIDQLKSMDQLRPIPYYDAFLNPLYHNKVFFIGDAAHALSPTLSAGTNLALLDSYLLAEALKTTGNVSEAAVIFHKSRKSQLKYYYKMSRLVTPLFQSDYKVAWIRNWLFPLATKIPPGPRILADTALGVRKSIFSRISKELYV